MLSLRTALILLGSLAIGSVSVVLQHIASRKLPAVRSDAAQMLTAGLVSLAIYAAGLVLLIYLVAPARKLAPAIALAWMAGVGLMRWHLRD
jgi:hypothetical protein